MPAFPFIDGFEHEKEDSVTGDSDVIPPLRAVEPIRLNIQGMTVFGLKDPLQLSEHVVCLPREALGILVFFDGMHSILDVQAELTRRTGRMVFTDDIRAIVDKLDTAFLLDNNRYRQAFADKVAEYRAKPFRPASHAGLSYQKDPELLRADLDSFFNGDGGPGDLAHFCDSRRPKGLVAPHIDIRNGGACFAHGYHALAQGQPSDVYVIFGTGHSGVEGLFTACTLDFDTPLGLVHTDREVIRLLEEEFGADPASEEILHASEHVIEFQTVFLQYAFGERRDFTIVPIVTSLSPLYFDGDRRFEAERSRTERFCAGLKRACERSGKTVCYIASADLDHIGPRYGDQFVPHEGTVREALEKDRTTLSYLERLDRDGFVRDVAEDNDNRKICGFSPIVALLDCMEASEGRLLNLDYTYVDDKHSFVTFASVVFH